MNRSLRLLPVCLVLAALHLVLAPGALAQQFWQLTFSYNADGIFLLRAGQMPPLTKPVRTPGLEGAALKLDYQLEWLDEQGQVITATPVTIPLGGHSVLAEAGEGRGTDLTVPPAGVFALRVPGPLQAGQAALVRLTRNEPGGNFTVVPGPKTPAAFLISEYTLRLPEAGPAAAPGPISATKVRNTGPDANRFVVAILGDGFTAADLAGGTFSSKVVSFQSALFATSPWSSYGNLVNIYRVDIESAESGADYADASPDTGGTLKETYLDAGFWVGGTERCCYLRGNGVARAMAAADEMVGVGVWDEILVFVNSTKYGGCGGAVGVSSINSSSDEIQIHEFGHSFAGLADEYDYGSTSTNCTPSATRNIDCANNFPTVKWQLWVTPGTPIPTPNTSQYSSAVGAFEGASYQTKGIFRPMRDCKMRTLGVALCPVCKEAHILKLFQKVRISDSADPSLGPAEVPEYGTRTFRITPINVTGLTYQWYTNGVPILNATNVSLVVTGSQVIGTNFELRLEMAHNTTLVRAETILQTNIWTLRALPQPALSIGNATVAEGNSGTTQMVFPVTMSFAHTGIVQVSYATMNGTATSGSDYLATNGVLTFSAGQLSNAIRVTVLGDTVTEPDEILFVRLTNAMQATIRDRQGVGLILDGDHPPALAVTAPADGATFAAPANIPITVAASDADGSVSKVEFYRDATKLGERTQEPFSLTWSNVAAGSYLLTAIATDNSGKKATSAPVNILVQAGVAQNFVLLSLTNAWRYDATTNNLGMAWKDIAYDDSGWSGPSRALLHNESDPVPGPKNTQIPLSYNGARITSYYFRTHFNFPTVPSAGLILTSSNLVDDGAVFWLNGAEATRLRMPAGIISRTTLASATPSSGDASDFDVIVLPATNLVAGDNVLAVEVHQQSTNSSDVVFGMALEALQGFAPIIIDPNQPTNRTVVQGHSSVLTIDAAGSPAPYYLWYRNGLLVSASTNSSYTIASMSSGQAGNYQVRITNVVGAVTSRVAVVSYQGDTTPPELVYALASTNLTRVTVSFSETVNSLDAATIGNYRLSGGGSNLAVLVASLQGTNVLLTTATRAPGVNYVLTVNNVRDASGNFIPPDTSIAVATELVLVAADNSFWNYFQSDRDPGLGWGVPGFELSSEWGLGAALFDAKRPAGRSVVGPNNEPVRTMLNMINPPGAEEQTTTYYFRTVFNLPGPAAGARLRLRTLVDDGAVFYLNGLELYRLRMPDAPGTIAYTNYASASRADSENIYEGPFVVPATHLRDGENVLAVEVHQVNSGSSDMSFAAQLIGEVPMLGFAPLRLTVSPAVNGFYLNWEKPDAVLEQSSTVNGTYSPVGSQASSPFLVTPGPGMKFFRLRSE